MPLGSIRGIFVTHHHPDHNADWGNLQLLAWATDLHTPIASFGPPSLQKVKRAFLSLNEVDITTRMADEGRPALDRLMEVHDVTPRGVVLHDDRVSFPSCTGMSSSFSATKTGDSPARFATCRSQYRWRHFVSVQRIIGHKPGTGGSAGVGWLERVTEHRFFPELWSIRTML